MSAPASPLRLLVPCLVLVLLLGGCGGDDADSQRGAAKRSDASATVGRSGDDASDAPRTDAQIDACMADAGFTSDAPVTSSIAAWKHPSGTRAVRASSADETQLIASEIGTPDTATTIDGTSVVAGSGPDADAALACLHQ